MGPEQFGLSFHNPAPIRLMPEMSSGEACCISSIAVINDPGIGIDSPAGMHVEIYSYLPLKEDGLVLLQGLMGWLQ